MICFLFPPLLTFPTPLFFLLQCRKACSFAKFQGGGMVKIKSPWSWRCPINASIPPSLIARPPVLLLLLLLSLLTTALPFYSWEKRCKPLFSANGSKWLPFVFSSTCHIILFVGISAQGRLPSSSLWQLHTPESMMEGCRNIFIPPPNSLSSIDDKKTWPLRCFRKGWGIHVQLILPGDRSHARGHRSWPSNQGRTSVLFDWTRRG